MEHNYCGSSFQPEGCPAVLWTSISGRNRQKIHLISYNFMPSGRSVLLLVVLYIFVILL